MSRLALLLGSLLLLAAPTRSAPEVWIADPRPWETTEAARIATATGTVWTLEVGIRSIGRLVTGEREVPVSFPRVTIARTEAGETRAAAVLLPTDNQGVALFPPGAPEELAVPDEAIDDGRGRWPNLCRFSLLDRSGDLDLDGDGDPEVSIRRFCSCAGEGCSGIVLIELGDDGPRLFRPESLVSRPRLGPVAVERIEPVPGQERPILHVLPDFLADCRFIAELGVEGESECERCCRIPVLLRPVPGAGYETYFDRVRQAAYLERAVNELRYVAAGDPDLPLQSYEAAQVARAAAFFALTGSHETFRSIVIERLGPRAGDGRVAELLDGLERLFLP